MRNKERVRFVSVKDVSTQNISHTSILAIIKFLPVSSCAACFTDGSPATKQAHLMSHLHFLPHSHGTRSAHNGFVCQEAVVCLCRTMTSQQILLRYVLFYVNVVRCSSQFYHQRALLYGENGKELHQDPFFHFDCDLYMLVKISFFGLKMTL